MSRRSSTDVVPSIPKGEPSLQQTHITPSHRDYNKPMLSTGTLLPEFPSDDFVDTENIKLRDTVSVIFNFLYVVIFVM